FCVTPFHCLYYKGSSHWNVKEFFRLRYFWRRQKNRLPSGSLFRETRIRVLLIVSQSLAHPAVQRTARFHPDRRVCRSSGPIWGENSRSTDQFREMSSVLFQ